MKTRMWSLPLALAGLALAAFIGVALAENIDPFNNNSQFAWSENAGWLNAEPANCSNCGVQVSNTRLTGYIWGENIGWINLSCQNNSTCSGPGGNWGVTNNGSGALSGYAWAENAGWISFSCQNNPSTCAGTGNYGVTISPSTGVFSGFAWGENIGWISFSDASPVAYQVQTSDEDSDGVFAGSDNCPLAGNPSQTNTDAALSAGGARMGLNNPPPPLPADSFGDACDDDDDNDSGGLANRTSGPCPGTNVPTFSDCIEAYLGTNALDNCLSGPGTGGDAWPADISGGSPSGPDGFSDISDVIILTGDFGKPVPSQAPVREDLTGDGFVDISDITTILAFFSHGCN